MIQDQGLWNSLPIPSLIVDARDCVTEVNALGEAFLNLSSQSLVGRPLDAKISFEPPILRMLQRVRAQQSALHINDIKVGSQQRGATLCSLAIAPLFDTPGSVILQIRPREIADRMIQSNASGKAAKSAIGMAEMLAHEIKNPLAGITGAAQLLSMNLASDDRELTDLIVEESRRIVKLLEQVEQFGNILPAELKPINLHDILDRARKSASVGYAANMMMVEDYDPSLPRTMADPDQLLQVVLNLLKNAAQAGQPGGTITLHTYYDAALRVQRADDSFARLPLQIEVIDNGPGLPPAIADSIFEPFVSGRENGTGLGLALVSKLMADMGGWISVSSKPGRTVFRLSLPRAPDTPDVDGVS